MTNEQAAVARAAGGPPLLAVRDLSKSFGGVRALDHVGMEIAPGEVHGLLGQNGSGKSTLIKVLAGFHDPDPGGELVVNGRHVPLPLRAGEFRELGLSFVHQDLGLVPSLTVTENLRVRELTHAGRWHISWARERKRTVEAFERYGVSINPDAKVSDLSQIDRARLAIVRAVEDLGEDADGEQRARLLVLDEPTAFLPKESADYLFELIRRVADSGSSVLFVSHDLGEVLRVTDRVTVLRDGRVCGTAATPGVTEDQLVEMIIGRQLAKLEPHAAGRVRGEVDVSIRSVSGASLHDVSIDLRDGEVFGLTGLLGSGFEDLPYLLFGAVRARAGTVTVDGRVYDLAAMTPAAALNAGIALVPGDRQNAGSLGTLPVVDNVSMLVLGEYVDEGRLRRRRMVRDAGGLLEQYDVRPPDPYLAYHSLSGGNQQKALLAKWFRRQPSLLLLHEPTQGVDVGARVQIFEMIRAAAEAGSSIICASADYEQLAAICDRVAIVAQGRIIRELTGSGITKERIAEQCLTSMSGQDGPAAAGAAA